MHKHLELAPRLNKAEIKRRIERLNVPADLKALLSDVVDTTLELGGKIVDIGRRVLAFIFEFAKAYPHLTFGIAAALVLSHLVGSIPGVGPLLAPFLTPLLLIVGIGLGAIADLTDGPMRCRLDKFEALLRSEGVA